MHGRNAGAAGPAAISHRRGEAEGASAQAPRPGRRCLSAEKLECLRAATHAHLFETCRKNIEEEATVAATTEAGKKIENVPLIGPEPPLRLDPHHLQAKQLKQNEAFPWKDSAGYTATAGGNSCSVEGWQGFAVVTGNNLQKASTWFRNSLRGALLPISW